MHAQKISMRRVIFSRPDFRASLFFHIASTPWSLLLSLSQTSKAIISRNYRGDVLLNKSIERFANYLVEVEDEAKKPVFHVDTNGDVQAGEDVGATGTGGEHYVYVSVSTAGTTSPF
jgi:hypothetical protein